MSHRTLLSSHEPKLKSRHHYQSRLQLCTIMCFFTCASHCCTAQQAGINSISAQSEQVLAVVKSHSLTLC